MPANSIVIDVLNRLLQAEQGTVFRFMESGWPYLNRSSAGLRIPLNEMVKTSVRHEAELAGLIDVRGGSIAIAEVMREDQYLAFLAFKFLLPQLIQSKTGAIARYENALKLIGEIDPAVTKVLQEHLQTHRDQLAILHKHV